MIEVEAFRLAPDQLAPLSAALKAAGLPDADVEDAGRTFFVFRLASGEIAGFGGYEAYPPHALLRSIVVPPEHRNKGFGKFIASKLLHLCSLDGIEDVYVLTTDRQMFFSALGFVEIARDAVPACILQTRQAATLCPRSAHFLHVRMEARLPT